MKFAGPIGPAGFSQGHLLSANRAEDVIDLQETVDAVPGIEGLRGGDLSSKLGGEPAKGKTILEPGIGKGLSEDKPERRPAVAWAAVELGAALGRLTGLIRRLGRFGSDMAPMRMRSYRQVSGWGA